MLCVQHFSGAWSVMICCLLAPTHVSQEGEPEKPLPFDTTTEKIILRGSNVTASFKLLRLPAGKITLGATDANEKEYEIKPIWIGQYEVTWDEYDIFWQALDLTTDERSKARKEGTRPLTPYVAPDRDWGHDGFPAGSMHCRMAKLYCEWLSKQTGHNYRLPTEAEWEYACRAGAGAPLKPVKEELESFAWYASNSKAQTQHVGKKKPNAWGLHDMLGNVAEWVIQADGREAIAGGSFADRAAEVHSGARAYFDKSWQRSEPQLPKNTSWFCDAGFVGFRVVRDD